MLKPISHECGANVRSGLLWHQTKVDVGLDMCEMQHLQMGSIYWSGGKPYHRRRCSIAVNAGLECPAAC